MVSKVEPTPEVFIPRMQVGIELMWKKHLQSLRGNGAALLNRHREVERLDRDSELTRDLGVEVALSVLRVAAGAA